MHSGDSNRLDGLLASIRDLDVQTNASLPPVMQWTPARTGKIDITIKRNGDWIHEGGLIQRQRLVRLFASILRLDDDGHTYLVTPAERLRITVEDAPFTAVLLEKLNIEGSPALQFTTNVGDVVVAGAENPIEVGQGPDSEPLPYVTVRHGLKALISRPVFYQLVDYAEEQGNEWVVRSAGTVMSLGTFNDV